MAAYGREVGRREDGGELFSRTICGESILFWRTEAGQVTAMSDRCVHRRFPLSEAPSHRVGDTVVCGYHGFTYGPDGVCVAVPGQTRMSRTARLKSYPVVEQDSFVWVFIGDPARADATRIPRAPWLDSKGWTTLSGVEPLAARAGRGPGAGAGRAAAAVHPAHGHRPATAPAGAGRGAPRDSPAAVRALTPGVRAAARGISRSLACPG